uniref:Uncharacterized protein n=1 Tax=Populus trichocarpa TaxID=3694 RepID=B9I2T3_POPTR
MANGWVVREAELTVGGWFEDGGCCVGLVVCEDLEMGLGLNGRRLLVMAEGVCIFGWKNSFDSQKGEAAMERRRVGGEISSVVVIDDGEAVGFLFFWLERDEPVNGVMMKGGSLWPWVEKK